VADATTRPAAFDSAMDDDIAVPQALAVLHETVREGNGALAAGSLDAAATAFDGVLAMVDVLGINPWASPWSDAGSAGAGRETEVIDALVKVVLAQRQEARARKDYAAADAIRDGLDEIGIRVEDTASGVRWSL
jgi:cysteinyl-tRNA synthetase